MATNATGTGVNSLFWGIRDSNGYLKGTSGTVANGADSGMGRLRGVSQVSIPTPQSSIVPALGDNGVVSGEMVPAQDIPAGTIVTSVNDPVFDTVVQGTKIVDADGYDFRLGGVPCPVFPSVSLIVNSPARNQSPGQLNNPGYLVRIVPSATIQPSEPDLSQAQAMTFSHQVIPNMFDKLPWGATVDSSTWGASRGTQLRPFWSLYPLTMHTFVADGTTTTFTVDETPAAANGNVFLLYRNGTKLVYTTAYTVNTSTKTVTLVSAGTAGDVFVALYGFVGTC